MTPTSRWSVRLLALATLALATPPLPSQDAPPSQARPAPAGGTSSGASHRPSAAGAPSDRPAVRGIDPATGALDRPWLRERWRGAMEAFGVPGCAVAIVQDGEVLALEGLGVRDPEGRPVDADTMFYIASATKPYVATAVVALAERGRLDLDDPVAPHLPRFTLADGDAAARVTVRQLLDHEAGLNSGPIVFLDAYSGEITEERYWRWMTEVEPAGHLDYSNLHYTLLGRLVEAVTGEHWKTHLEGALFEPLGLDRTTASASRMYADENVALPMTDGEDGFVACRVRKTDRVMHAAGGLGTTARDAARWILAHMPGGALVASGMLSAEALADMQRLQGSLPAPRGSIRRMEGFGLGWQRGTFRGRPYLVHGGGYVGTAAHISLLPEHGIGVAVLANASGGGHALADMISIDVYDALLGLSEPDLLPRYVQRAEQFTGEPLGPRRDLPASVLSAEPEEYAGRFTHADWGTIVLESVPPKGRLTARMGDLVFDLTGRGRNACTMTAGGGSVTFEAEFVVDDDGHLRAVRLVDEEDGPIVFRRE